MAEEIKGIVDIEVKDDHFVSFTKKGNTALKKLSDAADETSEVFDELGTQLDQTGKDAKKLGTDAKKAGSDLKKLGSDGKKAGTDVRKTGTDSKKTGTDVKSMGVSARKAGTDVKKLGTDSSQAAVDVRTLGTESKGTASSLNSMGNSTQQLGQSMTTTSVATLGLAQGFTGISDTVFGFQEKVVALERSKLGLEDLTIQVRRAEEDLSAALEEGTLNADERARMEEDLTQLRKAHATEIRTVKAEEEALNGEYVTFAVNTGATAIQTYIVLNEMLGAHQIAQIKTRAQVFLTSKTFRASIFDITAFRTSIAAARLQTSAFGTVSQITAGKIRLLAFSFKGLYAAMGPVGWALIGITTAYELLAHNVFGARDAVLEFIKMLEDFLPILRGLSAAFNSLVPDLSQTAEELENIDATTYDLNQTFLTGTETINDYNTALSYTGDIAISTGNGLTGTAKIIADVFEKSRRDPFGKLVENHSNVLSAMEHIVNEVERGNISIESARLLIEELVPTYSKLDRELMTATGVETEIDRWDKLGDKIKNVIDLDVQYSRQKKSLTTSSIADEIIKSKPTGSARSDDLDAIRQSIKEQQEQEFKNLRDRTGALTSLANQEINAKFAALKRRMEYQQNYWHGHIQSILIENKLRDDYIKSAVQSFNAQTGNNYANPNFETGGGYTPGRAGRNRKAQQLAARREKRRQQEAEAQRYYNFFGKKPRIYSNRLNFRTHLSLDGFPNLEESQQQLSEFAVPLDFSKRIFRDKIKDEVPRRVIGKSVGRVYHYSRYVPAVYDDVLRTPTKFEAVMEALRISEEREQVYNQALNQDTNLIELERRHDPIHRILAYNSSNPHAETEVLDRYRYEARIIMEGNLL